MYMVLVDGMAVAIVMVILDGDLALVEVQQISEQ